MRTVLADHVALQARQIRFLVTGVINTALDFAVFTALLRLADLAAFYANLAAFTVAVCCSYLLSRFWSFADRRGGSSVSFLLWMAAIALSASWLLARLVAAGLHVALAKVAVTALVMVLSYSAMNLLVFRADRARTALLGGLAALLASVGLTQALSPDTEPRGLPKDMRALYFDTARPPVETGLKVYHLGHSLVGRDMPAMLQQLAGDGHDYRSQLGWGTSLSQHLRGPDAIPGYAEENDHLHFEPLSEVLTSPDYDVLVFTEMIGLDAAIRYHDSAAAVRELIETAHAANPDLSFALYETWHPLNEGDWVARIPEDRATMWEPALLAPAIEAAGGAPVRIIPAGTVMAELVRRAEATAGGIGGMTSRHDLFSDNIHLNDLGQYLVALTHYTSLYRTSPEGLPHRLRRADGTPAQAPTPELAREMQRVVWQVVSSSPLYR